MKAFESARSLFEEYARSPERFWPAGPGSSEHRQVRKLRRSVRVAGEAGDAAPDAVIAETASLALARAERRPPPIYVMGLGGSGSHWLAEMLAQLMDAVDTGEVYLPGSLLERMSGLPPDEQGFVVDCLHLLHARGFPTNAGRETRSLLSARVLNSAGGVVHPRLKAWDPNCFIVHMVHDPREQVTSVTFRKPGYRQEVSADSSDDEYLTDRARAAVRHHAAWRNSSVEADFVCRYERLRGAPVATLEELLSELEEAAAASRVAEVARNHDASLMQQGTVLPRGNFFLDDGRGSRRQPSERQRALLHSELVEVRASAGYPSDDCLGERLALAAHPRERKLHFPAARSLGALWARDGDGDSPEWRSLGPAAGTVSVPLATIVKLRVAEVAPAEEIEALTGLPADGLDSLCLAGNRQLTGELLGALATSLRGLREIDLARTAICADDLARLAPLTGLEGLSLLGTATIADDVSRLSRHSTALPNCKVVV